jgi:hypothetical protein
MEQQLSRELINLATCSYYGINNIADQQEHTDKIDLIKFLLSENTTPINLAQNDTNYNANLFYHPWVFTDAEYAATYVRDGRNIQKNPLMGIFHPFGSIYALPLQSRNITLNDLAQIYQHFHGDEDGDDFYSPKTGFFHIDYNDYGKAYTVCVDPTTLRGRVDLLIYIPKNKEKIIQNIIKIIYGNRIINDSPRNLFDLLCQINELKKLFNTWEIDRFKNVGVIRRKHYHQYIDSNIRKFKGLFLFDYRAGDIQSKEYCHLVQYNIFNRTGPTGDVYMESTDIPYIDEIKSKIDIRFRDNIVWELGVNIVTKTDE